MIISTLRSNRPLRATFLLTALFTSALVSRGTADTPSEPSPPAAATSTLPILGPSPTWKLTDLAGQEIGRDSLLGKVVVVDFWATWCPPCVHEIPGYIALQKKYGERGLVIIGLSVDQKGAAAVTPFAQKHGINYALALADEATINAFGGIEGIPTTFLIDREGRIRDKKVGAMDADAYEKLITPLL